MQQVAELHLVDELLGGLGEVVVQVTSCAHASGPVVSGRSSMRMRSVWSGPEVAVERDGVHRAFSVGLLRV
ncbi:hypothetical protein [Streptomyces sp. NPDC006267]|uniref:hypothetical protein n=1 Tax=unclassified Streptomyces TaxID=2593676 RepID=UPI0033A32B9C